MQITIPKSWNELTRAQLLQIADLFTRNLDRTAFKIKALLKLSGMQVAMRLPREESGIWYHELILAKRRFELSDLQLQSYIGQLDFLLEASQLTENRLPKLNGRIGPDKALANISWAEFETAEGYFGSFSKTKDEIQLDRLIATLYRKADRNNRADSSGFTGDRRETFNPHLVEKQAAHFKSLPMDKKYAVYLFYSGCRNNIVAQFGKVFSADSSGSGEPDPLCHINLVNAINNGDITKNGSIRKTALFEILIFLQKKAEDAEKMETELQH